MKTIRLSFLLVAAPAALSLGLLSAAQHGHGHMPDPDEHFEIVVERLELTEAQRETLAKPFGDAFAVMEELHRLHAVIEEELTEAQKDKLAQMIHESLGVSAAREGGHGRSHR